MVAVVTLGLYPRHLLLLPPLRSCSSTDPPPSSASVRLLCKCLLDTFIAISPAPPLRSGSSTDPHPSSASARLLCRGSRILTAVQEFQMAGQNQGEPSSSGANEGGTVQRKRGRPSTSTTTTKQARESTRIRVSNWTQSLTTEQRSAVYARRRQSRSTVTMPTIVAVQINDAEVCTEGTDRWSDGPCTRVEGFRLIIPTVPRGLSGRAE